MKLIMYTFPSNISILLLLNKTMILYFSQILNPFVSFYDIMSAPNCELSSLHFSVYRVICLCLEVALLIVNFLKNVAEELSF